MGRWRQAVDPGRTTQDRVRDDPDRTAVQAGPEADGRPDARTVPGLMAGLAAHRVAGRAAHRVAGLAAGLVPGRVAGSMASRAPAARADRQAIVTVSVDGQVAGTTTPAEAAAPRTVAADPRVVTLGRASVRTSARTVGGPLGRGAAAFGPVRREDRTGPAMIDLPAHARGSETASAGPRRVVGASVGHPASRTPIGPVTRGLTVVGGQTGVGALTGVGEPSAATGLIVTGGIRPTGGPALAVLPGEARPGRCRPGGRQQPDPAATHVTPFEVGARIEVVASTADSVAGTARRTNGPSAASSRPSRTSRPYPPTSTPGCCIEPSGPNSAACPKNWLRSSPPTW